MVVQIKLHDCCYNCGKNDIDVSTFEFCSDLGMSNEKHTEVFCTKDSVCKFVEKEINKFNGES